MQSTLFAILKSFEGFALQKVSQALKHSTCTTVFGHPFGSARLIMVGAILEHLEMCRWFWRNLPIKNGVPEVSMLSWPYYRTVMILRYINIWDFLKPASKSETWNLACWKICLSYIYVVFEDRIGKFSATIALWAEYGGKVVSGEALN